MALIFSDSTKALTLILATLLVAGCPRGGGEPGEKKIIESSPTTDAPDAESKQSLKLSEERLQLEKAREYLDSGENALSMRIARGLLDSKDPEVLSGLVDIFGWIGRRAMPELEELIARDVPNVSIRALDAWEMAIDEISSEYWRTVAITNAATKISDSSVIDAILMHTFNIRVDYVLPALEGMIIGQRGKVAGECAKVMFSHVAGESYSSPERTKLLIKNSE